MPTLRLGATALAAAMLAAACNADAPSAARQRADEGVRVVVEPLEFASARTRAEAVGTSRAIRSIELHPAASGEVTAVRFAPGQHVSEGDVLVELDSRDERLAVELARLRLADAERLYDRYQRSGESGAVVPTALDAARTAVESARIDLDRAQVALDDRTIEAPFDGHVDITEVDPGDRITPETVITTLDDRSELLVSFEVPETLIGELARDDEVLLSVWNRPGSRLEGRIVDIGSRIDPATRTFTARAVVDNSGDGLRPGMSFRVSLDIEGMAYPVIAETAVQWGAEGAYVWTVVDGQAERVPVDIVQRQQGRVLVEANLALGDLVVIEGIQRMRSGIDVVYDVSALANRKPRALANPSAEVGD